ncbi:mannitol dehydrogenase family protein [Microbacterium murale]|uniref:Mannitol-1-phosphate 5-dehydrogenase n=1 Tax=Microbacterium murale TaxID=1081040 RepID=A0ABQ1R9L6_9MICO|nr:mannitol dehydrogenase family protein [Microbacterium murale]GGD63172.1 mannitol-1-phosphate 5-dehydrogenase [Microbacterium murale]
MTETVMTALSRAAAADRAGRSFDRAPVRIAHLGLGAFHRAHQAWYTDIVDEANEWGIRSFTGRSPAAAQELDAQDGLYSLIERSAAGDSIALIDSIVDAVDGARVDVLAETLADPATALVTLTITEAGYALDAAHEPDLADETVAADVEWLRTHLAADRLELSSAPTTALARLLVGLEARRRADAGPIAVVSCDNLPGNGELTQRALTSFARLAGASDTLAYLNEHVAFPSTSIDRITPKTTQAEIELVRDETGWDDRSPVVTEPFHDWVISGEFPAGRPAWEKAGARFVDDIDPFERRKLWLLNGSHSFLAYAGAARGHETVAQAIGDPVIRGWVNELWDEAARHLTEPHLGIDDYRAALLERFDNARIQHLLAQIGKDGTTKLRLRILEVLLAERSAGRDGAASIRVLGAWAARALDGALPEDTNGQAVADAASRGEGAIPALLALIDERLTEPEIVAAVARAAANFTQN